MSKRFLVALGVFPLLVHASTPAPQTKVDKGCERGCPFWGFEEMENFFNRPLRLNSFSSISSMKETDKAYFITIDLPGMDKKDISIETLGNRIHVSGERKDESESKEGSKRSYRQFSQSYLLPDDANIDAINAASTNGVLKITIPKSGKKASKKIEIK